MYGTSLKWCRLFAGRRCGLMEGLYQPRQMELVLFLRVLSSLLLFNRDNVVMNVLCANRPAMGFTERMESSATHVGRRLVQFFYYVRSIIIIVPHCWANVQPSHLLFIYIFACCSDGLFQDFHGSTTAPSRRCAYLHP